MNDEYGHTEGDRALKGTANILCECFSGNNFLARYGGDEFSIVIKDCDQKMLDIALIRLEELRVKQNKSANRSYEIKFSIGAYVFKKNEITDVHSMFMRVDKIMYDNKNAKKNEFNDIAFYENFKRQC